MRSRTAPRRGPGLVGTVARTAVIAGTATVVAGATSNAMQNKAQQKQAVQEMQQAQQQAAQQAQIDAAVQQAMAAQQAAAPAPAPTPAPAPAAPAGGDLIAQLQQLAGLKEAGALSDAEFEAAKAKLLAGG